MKPSIQLKTDEEVELIKKSALLVSQTLAEVAKFIRPGISTLDIDDFCGKFVLKNGGKPSFNNYRGFPFNICASVNDVIIHGFPTSTPLKDGDLIGIDLGVYMNGFHGDHAYTFILGEVKPEVLDFVSRVKTSLYKGIEQCIEGNTVGDIGAAIQYYTNKLYQYGIVEELSGHGLGKNLHEEPAVLNIGKKGKGKLLLSNTVLAIEPMINMGKKNIVIDKDGWTIRTKDKSLSCHFEHNVCVKKYKPYLLSDFNIIEKAEKENKYLNSSYY